MTTETTENIAQTLRDVIAEQAECSFLTGEDTLNSAWVLSVPTGRRVEDITDKIRTAAQYLKPARRKGRAQLATLQSLIDWANRFKGETSILYADPNRAKPSLTCIANYHGAGEAMQDDATADPAANHADHRGIYAFPLSKEWQRWMAISGQPLDKAEMGQFIDDNAKDFIDPSPRLLGQGSKDDAEPWEQRLMDVSRKIDERFGQYIRLRQMSRAFEVHEASNLVATRNPNTGEASISFVNEHRDAEGQPIQIPGLFLIAIPVFESGVAYRLPLRFQYRKSGAQVKFTLTVYDPERAFDDAFSEALETATEATALPLLLGTPEQ